MLQLQAHKILPTKMKIFFFFFTLLIIINQFVAANKSALNSGDEINSLDPISTLLSANEKFTLGFFTMPSTNFTYLGIWVTNSYPIRYVWVANREKPMTTNGSLIINNSGNLNIINGRGAGGAILFNISKEESSGNTTAKLEDSGNFILYDTGNKNRKLWQSFHHPTDTILPLMKLGYNITSNQSFALTSWLSDEVPASGAFTMKLEQKQNLIQVVIYKRGKIYWSSGAWEDELKLLDLSGFLINDATGICIYFQSNNNNNAKSMLQLSSMGELIDSANNPVTPKFCYDGYQSNDGCAISAENCRSSRGGNDSFLLENGKWEGEFIQYDGGSKIGLSDCMERCWNDCNCMGFSGNSNGTGCFTWGRNAQFHLNESYGEKIGVLTSHKPPKRKIWIWILVSLGVVLISVLTAYLCYVRIKRHKLEEADTKKKDDYAYRLTGLNSFNYGDELVKDITDAPDIKIFSLAAILTATNNFSNDNKLGHGGYGPVYKGKLFDGREIAVKRLSKTSLQGFEQFKSELILISKLQHTNLVRLYGCCIHQEEKMLIYEFMPNKSLDIFLYVEDEKKRIDWQIRFNIIEGVGQGLLYLHKYSRMRVIHRDLKASNVLLDKNMHPKIADFGIARIFQHNVTEATTHTVVGTYGYMAPEYAMEGTFSIKSDVFSFGVLILEIVSGKRNSSFYHLDRPLNLVGYAWELWKGHAALELKDEALGESCDVKQLLKTIHIGLLCVQENAGDRPTMSEVLYMLNNEITDIPNPKQPSFFTGRHPVEVRTKSTDLTFDRSVQVCLSDLTLSTAASLSR